jgi:hypothetical protein
VGDPYPGARHIAGRFSSSMFDPVQIREPSARVSPRQ